MTTASILRAQKVAQAAFEKVSPAFGNPATVILALDGEESDSLAADVDLGQLEPRVTSDGQERLAEPLSAHIRIALLPEWASVEALARGGHILANDKDYRITEARNDGYTVRLTAFRWPEEE